MLQAWLQDLFILYKMGFRGSMILGGLEFTSAL